VEKKLDIKQALRVFSKVTEYGQRSAGEYRLGGLWASTDHDGYTAILRDDAVSLYIYFHNTYKFDFSKKIQLNAFMDTLREVDRKEFQSR